MSISRKIVGEKKCIFSKIRDKRLISSRERLKSPKVKFVRRIKIRHDINDINYSAPRFRRISTISPLTLLHRRFDSRILGEENILGFYDDFKPERDGGRLCGERRKEVCRARKGEGERKRRERSREKECRFHPPLPGRDGRS